ncbi:hypothetical protein Tco_1472578, partial [Tanacetum coccineum]
MSSSSIGVVVRGGVLGSVVLIDTPAVVTGALAVVTGSAVVSSSNINTSSSVENVEG